VTEQYDIIERHTPGGRAFRATQRYGTNDGAVMQAILGDDEYRLASIYPITGWVLDIGAHVGTVGLAIALDNPDARVVMVEPLPSNLASIAANIELAGVGDRVTLEAAAATDTKHPTVDVTHTYASVTGVDQSYLDQCRHVGNIFRQVPDGPVVDSQSVTVPGISLAALLKKYSIGRVALLKIDCEGCEWQFLRSKALARVDRIVGEYHDALTFADLVAMLDRTHVVTQWSNGPVGLFGAVRR
jgi:FkbM family methyltransferase